MKNRQALTCCLVLVLVLCIGPPAMAIALPEGVVGMFERTDGGYFTLIDVDTEEPVTKCARALDVGDAYINGDNHRFEVTSIAGDTVYVQDQGKLPAQERSRAEAGGFAWFSDFLSRRPSRAGDQETTPEPEAAAGRSAGSPEKTATHQIAMYCTHSDESYIPTSGVSSKEWGDVYDVMDALEKEFLNRGLQVSKSPNNHNPHDSQAYVRSRRTAMDLLRDRPLVILDIHRDAVPRHEYLAEVEGTELSAVQIVVGRQNQNREANLEFARLLKDAADQEFPGLIKGIFDAKGNYNQDLAPRSLLLEFGTHETSLEMAEKAAGLISDLVLAAAGASKPMGRAGSRSVLWIVGFMVLAAIAWVTLNAVGWEGVRRFFGTEFRVGSGSEGPKSDLDGLAVDKRGRRHDGEGEDR